MLDDELKDQRKRRLRLAAVLIGPIVIFLALRAVWQAQTREPYMKTAITSYCISHYLPKHINCDSWAADVMRQHHDEIMACYSGNFDADIKCVDSLGLEP